MKLSKIIVNSVVYFYILRPIFRFIRRFVRSALIPAILGIVGLSMMSAFNSCSSVGEKTLSTYHDQETPEWVEDQKFTFVDDEKVFFKGHATSSAAAMTSSLFRISDNQARFEVAKAIETQAQFIFQNAEEGLNGANFSRFFGSEVAKRTMHAVTLEKRFWEKRLEYAEDGEQEVRLHAYTLISIPTKELKKAIREASRKDDELSQTLRDGVDQFFTDHL